MAEAVYLSMIPMLSRIKTRWIINITKITYNLLLHLCIISNSVIKSWFSPVILQRSVHRRDHKPISNYYRLSSKCTDSPFTDTKSTTTGCLNLQQYEQNPSHSFNQSILDVCIFQILYVLRCIGFDWRLAGTQEAMNHRHTNRNIYHNNNQKLNDN